MPTNFVIHFKIWLLLTLKLHKMKGTEHLKCSLCDGKQVQKPQTTSNYVSRPSKDFLLQENPDILSKKPEHH